MTMRRLLACCLLLVACDDEPTPSDARVDARVVDGGGLDASADAAPDGAVDAAVDARIDAALDASRDAALDSGVDAAADAGEDATVDALIDAVVDAGPPPHPLRLNEAMADNEGAWLDAEGEADDWFELYNAGPEPLLLAGFRVGDKRNDGHLLPAIELAPGATQLFWADDTPAQGQDHLPFKLSAGGETLYLWSPDGTLIDTMVLPPSAPNDSFQRMPDGQGPPIRCRFASPERANGEVCGPPPPPELPEEVVFPEYAWAEPWPFPPTPLAVTEIALRPAGFVEVLNVGDAALDLADFALRLAPQKPGQPWPARDQGALLAWPVALLAPGERVAVPVPVEATAVLEADPEFEGGADAVGRRAGVSGGAHRLHVVAAGGGPHPAARCHRAPHLLRTHHPGPGQCRLRPAGKPAHRGSPAAHPHPGRLCGAGCQRRGDRHRVGEGHHRHAGG